MTDEDFEARRLAYFRDAGVDVVSRRIPDRDGRPIYALVREGPTPLLMIHGGMAEAAIWQPLARLLPRDVGLVIPDRPGHGSSYKLRYGGESFRRQAADFVHDLVAGLGIRPTVVANSMGGFFALCHALAYPGEALRLVLLGAPAGLDRPGVPAMMRPLALGLFRRLILAKSQSVDQARDFWGKVLVAHPDRVPDELLHLEAIAAALPGNPEAVDSMLREILDLGGFRRRNLLRDDVERLAVPTWFLWGDRDTFAGPDSGRSLAARMPHAAFELLHDTGHIPMVDDPAACARAVTAILGRREIQWADPGRQNDTAAGR